MKTWIENISGKDVKIVKGKTRLRKEHLFYAIELGMMLGYFVPSLKLGIKFTEPVEIPSDLIIVEQVL